MGNMTISETMNEMGHVDSLFTLYFAFHKSPGESMAGLKGDGPGPLLCGASTRFMTQRADGFQSCDSRAYMRMRTA